ncbi:hypothetical protein [Streptomyces sp. NPDC127092]|uniref:hypothetical protein n=1 Tax=Streptomyces sp. NPDC127092 TaxID=3347135 RepID=UPI003668E677
MLTLLAVVLLASAVLATTGPFAHAYTNRHAALGGQAEITPSGAEPHCAASVPPVHPSWGDPTGSPQARDHHRAVTPRASGRADRPTAALDREPAAGRGESVTGTPHEPASRGSRAPSRAALQVFRC